ncbi:MAG TPA: sigma-70 family RNA polymerase sigma factor [Bryobacteraceae bacterium]|jgi:RNA polymerase sigma-70 factor (ECF subfamily)
MSNPAEIAGTRSDPELLEAARGGDQEAFGELVLRHQRRCLNLATSILRDRGEAEEETQNACWKAFEHLDRFQGQSEFSSWLFRIVKNQCLMRLRRRQGARFVRLDDRRRDDRVEPMQLTAVGADPEGELGAWEVHQVLRAEIGRIPPLLRNAIVLRDVQQLSMNDLAEELGITVAAAKSRLLRARLKLRQRMMRHCGRSGAHSLLTETPAGAEKAF